MSGLRQRIEQTLANMAEPMLLTEPNTPALRKRLERQARVAMDTFVRSGEVVAFTVHIAEGPHPTVDVTYREPKRVQAVVVRFSLYS